MRALAFDRFGDSSVLRWRTVPRPVPGMGEVLVCVEACAVNHIDLDIRAGTSRFDIQLPHILGREIVGDVVAVGPDVDSELLGRRFLVQPSIPCGLCERCQGGQANLCLRRFMPGVSAPGGYAEYVVVPARGLIEVSRKWSAAELASVPISMGTAWRMLVTHCNIKAGSTLLVFGAAGGLGAAGVQIGNLSGATVLAAAGSAAKLDMARRLGASHIIDYSREDVAAKVLEITGGKGVDVVLEQLGGAIFEKAIKCLSCGGCLITAGGHAGEIVRLDLVELFRRECRIVGTVGQTRAEIRQVLGLCEQGRLLPVVGREFDIREAGIAHELVASRRLTGKAVLVRSGVGGSSSW